MEYRGFPAMLVAEGDNSASAMWSEDRNKNGTNEPTVSESESDHTESEYGPGSAASEGNVPRQPLDHRLAWSKFTRSLFEMANAEENGFAIGFSPDGNFLEIRDAKQLGEVVLPKYYKHRNVSSFVRQLNNYGFKTIPSPGANSSVQSYHHENFRKGRLDLLCHVVRKTSSKEDANKKGKKAFVNGEEIEQMKMRERELMLRMEHLEEQNRHLILENTVLLEENKQLRMNINMNEMDYRQHYPGFAENTYNAYSQPSPTHPQVISQGPFFTIPDPPLSVPPYGTHSNNVSQQQQHQQVPMQHPRKVARHYPFESGEQVPQAFHGAQNHVNSGNNSNPWTPQNQFHGSSSSSYPSTNQTSEDMRKKNRLPGGQDAKFHEG